MKNSYPQKNGFTLIEIMVATSIFMIIMLIAMGALITSSNVTKRSSALRTAMDNVNFAMESMTRTLRTGTDYSCQFGDSILITPETGTMSDCTDGQHGIIFSSAYHEGSYDSGYIWAERGDNTHTVKYCGVKNPDNSCQELVASNVDIQNLTFYVNGSSPTDTIQPSVYITLKGRILIKGEATDFAIQTAVSQRTAE